MKKVSDYIQDHLGENLTVDQLSQVAHFSKFHFHRQFAEYTGMNVFKYIQLLRLKRASMQLVFNKHRRITDIALEAGFESPESFSRAFKKIVLHSPSQFRQRPDWKGWTDIFHFSLFERKQHMNINIVNFQQTKVAVFEHRGSPDTVYNSAEIFIVWRKETKLSPVNTSRTFGIAYDDPKTTDPEQFRFDICGSVTSDVPENSSGIITKVIPGGRCAVLRHNGSHDDIAVSVHYLYGEWLPGSGEELRDFPCFFHYLNLVPLVEEHALMTDIHLPLR